MRQAVKMVNKQLLTADIGTMDFQEMLDIVKQTLLDKRVFVPAIFLFVFLMLVDYVVRYKKKPVKVRKTHISAAPAAKPATSSEENSESAADDSEKNAKSSASKEKSAVAAKPAPAKK